ncbi:F-box/LRR-repeat protein At1g67190 [Dendrobium catenatum]|uniref:F-box/LRR-repeat protein n=1 Tax=Dendrobium catenatum TaxID=906689 RepID=A0A2I0VLY9_9ASPA|nr:F-box/LRR-repeat protein At1g67190 [Dendrobium catenatum]PKU64426.1 F-box/LRR-repeat protein [Dendrobium catenatum]
MLSESFMDNLPVEVVGNILSHLGSARKVVVASSTCRKWRESFRKHLHTLCFSSDDFPAYRDLTTRRLEIIITQTIFQTIGLQCLSIRMDHVQEFSAAPVIAWLMYTRETLRSLSFNVCTVPTVNILEKCGRQKLEVLDLDHNSVFGVEPSYQRFNSLRSFSLRHASVSALDLSLLLAACPKIETLTLVSLEIVTSDSLSSMELSSLTLRSLYAKALAVDKIILEADNLENLQLDTLNLDLFELIGKGALKIFKLDDVSITHLDIGESMDHLEVIDVSTFTITWSKFYQMLSRSSKLRKLRLWGVVFDDEDEMMDSETVAICFPHLKHLCLSYDTRDSLFNNGLHGSLSLKNVTTLELGWSVIGEHFGQWVFGMVDRCPNLNKLVIHGVLSEAKTREECQMLANFTSSVFSVMRKYVHVDVLFEYE